MKTYLVGGAVRDQLLGLPIKDRDWVVVGSTPDELLTQGYQPVGKDFPVFLHPDTREEYALARTERKSGHGYRGFQFHAAADVTLEQDLARRDVTINAIAQADNGDLIDPYNGQQDITDRILRHVSPAFVEDPVRVLRIARFAARFDFKVAPETQALIRQIVASGELEHLVAERVWQELEKALGGKQPSRFFTSLRACGALQSLFPEVERLFGVPQPAKWHPEVDSGLHTMLVIDQAAKLTTDNVVRFAALCHDLGKGTTPKEILPKHIGHEIRSLKLTRALCKRIKAPREYQEMAEKVAEYHTHFHRLFEMKPKTILKLLDALDAFRRPQRLVQYTLAAEADSRGRTGYEDRDLPAVEVLQQCCDAAAEVTAAPFLAEGLQGVAVGEAIQRARATEIGHVMQAYKEKSV